MCEDNWGVSCCLRAAAGRGGGTVGTGTGRGHRGRPGGGTISEFGPGAWFLIVFVCFRHLMYLMYLNVTYKHLKTRLKTLIADWNRLKTLKIFVYFVKDNPLASSIILCILCSRISRNL
jgi:hypothetical protein